MCKWSKKEVDVVIHAKQHRHPQDEAGDSQVGDQAKLHNQTLPQKPKEAKPQTDQQEEQRPKVCR